MIRGQLGLAKVMAIQSLGCFAVVEYGFCCLSAVILVKCVNKTWSGQSVQVSNYDYTVLATNPIDTLGNTRRISVNKT
jgi:hypothetical protein